MRKQFIVTGLAVAAALAIGASAVLAQGRPNHFKANLDSYQEVPTLSTTGTGRLDIHIDDNAQTIEFEMTYSGLEGGAVLASHIHLGARATNGGVVAFLCGGGGKPPCPPEATGEAAVSGVITPADVIGPVAQGMTPGDFAEFVRAIRAGATYVNVHTAARPGGEIRGQLSNSNR